MKLKNKKKWQELRQKLLDMMQASQSNCDLRTQIQNDTTCTTNSNLYQRLDSDWS